MRVLSTEATTPNGNKYKISRLGRIVGTSGFGLYGAYAANKAMNSDEFVDELTRAAKDAVKNKVNYYKGARKVGFIATATAITALCGFIIGGALDFAVNRFSKNQADEKQKA